MKVYPQTCWTVSGHSVQNGLPQDPAMLKECRNRNTIISAEKSGKRHFPLSLREEICCFLMRYIRGFAPGAAEGSGGKET